MVTPDSEAQRKNNLSSIIFVFCWSPCWLRAALLARRNYRQGRADREGALRLAIVIFGLEVLLWLCRSHFVPSFEYIREHACCASRPAC